MSSPESKQSSQWFEDETGEMKGGMNLYHDKTDDAVVG